MAHNAETPNRIHLLGSGTHEENLAAAAITPGHLLKLNSANKVAVHASAGGVTERLFALEDALQGRTIATAYAADEIVAVLKASPGDHVYAFLSEGEYVNIGDTLVSNGDGTLKPGTTNVVGVALENLDASDTASEGDQRLKIRVV